MPLTVINFNFKNYIVALHWKHQIARVTAELALNRSIGTKHYYTYFLQIIHSLFVGN